MPKRGFFLLSIHVPFAFCPRSGIGLFISHIEKKMEGRKRKDGPFFVFFADSRKFLGLIECFQCILKFICWNGFSWLGSYFRNVFLFGFCGSKKGDGVAICVRGQSKGRSFYLRAGIGGCWYFGGFVRGNTFPGVGQGIQPLFDG